MIDPRKPNYASTPVSPDRPRFGYAPEGRGDENPVVTIVTPYFNTGAVFHETARCVLGQSLQRFEWLIVNDCSTDRGALAVLEEYRRLALVDARVRVVDHRVNHGLSAARNTGYRLAKAPYVFMLDSDDLIEPTTIEKCALFLECNPEFSFVKGLTVGFAGQQYLWERGFHNREEMLKENLVTATAMVRNSAYRAVGGFDERIRGGMEDWEFWLRCAEAGMWGATIPEFLDWYRRRSAPTDAWADLACDRRREDFHCRMRERFPRLFAGQFPAPARRWHMPNADLPERVRWDNGLSKRGRRALWIVPWFRLGGADKFNLDAAKMLAARGWELTFATTLPGHTWSSEFTRLTPDVFMLDHLAQTPDVPRVLRYLIDSRKPDVVVISNSELGYFTLPLLRSFCPGPVYVDYNHMEEPYWKNGGHPRQAVGSQDQLDLSIVASQHLKDWMTGRGADPERIEVCRIHVDTDAWRPDPALGGLTRRMLGVGPDQSVLLYPVRLTAQKQPMVFAEVVRRLKERLAGSGRGFVALVAGEGEDRPALERFIVQHGLEDVVRLRGSVPVGEMPALYAASDILFLPSMQEGIAMSVYEAMACGKVVVGAAVGGQAELVTPETGHLFAPQADKGAEAEVYTRALARLIQDPVHCREMGAAARARVEEHFTIQQMGDRLVQLFELAAHHKRTMPRQALTKGLAMEQAASGVDWLRSRDLCDELWNYRTEVMTRRDAERSATEARRRSAAAAVEWIESSRSWKLVQATRRLAMRGNEIPHAEDPVARLAHLRSSASFRLMMSMKRLPPLTLVSRMRHGRSGTGLIPDALRDD